MGYIDGDVGDLGGVIGEVDVFCVAIRMRDRVFYDCGASGIEVHTRRML